MRPMQSHLAGLHTLRPADNEEQDGCVSPKVTKPSFRHLVSPKTPCTPTRPLWLQRCEEATIRCPFPSCFALLQGHKSEDRLTVDCKGFDALWAVFDGHRHPEMSGYASTNVPKLVWGSSLWPASPGDALRNMLIECHENARAEELKGGSTAVVVAVTNGRIWCASAGDSRAVAGLRTGEVRRMSVDHTTSVPEEVARIKAMGGVLDWGRLGGTLPMTRGLGNFSLEADGFACLPDISVMPCTEVDFVILASDGLWDVVDDEAACRFVRSLGPSAIKHPGTGAGCAAELLCQHARRLGSHDDIAVVVAYFPPERVQALFAGAGA
mmetsp:Transcript_23318/g.59520  ORF Transcript_23318/g.59520 Transcript_23318/m.59520 type:complete len:324 (+) Transcript_23318:94-1065(+)